jgi:hypothetical protein
VPVPEPLEPCLHGLTNVRQYSGHYYLFCMCCCEGAKLNSAISDLAATLRPSVIIGRVQRPPSVGRAVSTDVFDAQEMNSELVTDIQSRIELLATGIIDAIELSCFC